MNVYVVLERDDPAEEETFTFSSFVVEEIGHQTGK